MSRVQSVELALLGALPVLPLGIQLIDIFEVFQKIYSKILIFGRVTKILSGFKIRHTGQYDMALNNFKQAIIYACEA
jgi:hypothetical protein